MLDEEADLISDILRTMQPNRCLEWGSGSSTKYFSRFLTPAGRWLAIEHDADWARKVRSQITSPSIQVLHIPVGPARPSSDAGRSDDERFANYVAAAEPYGPYDFVLVDGRSRAKCLLLANTLLAPRGVAVLHDANRARYQLGKAPYKYQFELLGRGEGQLGIWIGSNDVPIEDVLDVRGYTRLWNLCVSAGALSRMLHYL